MAQDMVNHEEIMLSAQFLHDSVNKYNLQLDM